MKSVFILCVFLSFALLGCSGGGGGDGADDGERNGAGSQDNAVNVGVLLNSPVANIGYRTASRQGYTNERGEFTFLTGESVVFYIGGIEFPEVVAKPKVTPLDLARSEKIRDEVVVNISRLLQTLDSDLSNVASIVIHEQAHAAATQVDFRLPTRDFENSTAVQALIFNAGQPAPPAGLVTAQQAIERLAVSLEQRGISYTDSSEETGLTIPSRFIGNWSGSGVNRFTGGTESFVMTVGRDGVTGRNVTFNCDGELSVFDSSDHEVILEAKVVGPCWSDNPVRLTYQSSDSVLMTIYTPGSAENIDDLLVGGTVELSRI